MYYAKANQRPNSLYWDWTTTRGRQTRRSLPCTEECRHPYKEDAEKHFYKYCLEMAEEHPHKDRLEKCVECGEWTDTAYGNKQLWLLMRPVELCGKHRNKKDFELSYPFTGKFYIVHS